jgi:uncharacterized protein
MMRVVLDSNVVVSALLFNGRTSALVPLWRSGRFSLLANEGMVREYAAVLAYPKFKLTGDEISRLIHEELMPCLAPVKRWKGKLAVLPTDATDIPFIQAALSGQASYLVTGDKHLLVLNGRYPFRIVPPGVFLGELEKF